ncbi:xanthine dehydrogenase molybdopterin-binding subunit B [Nitrospirillum amazonense]|uniref:Xanthine dehydrogenase molybdopterin-binding subunit B n=1 Tax=Nitrospirillum amazonense TaxID=28077 RepID=A0A560FP22_9PROT|nr:molybdopterin cofactor-binding domain-containing protein [Nitrospirillum amazonense]TWB23377.1 xanthine dehydrogenase molybdopterin-binding subunit B [Nitrospirillum amazonense]
MATATGSATIPPAIASAGIPYERPLSRGTQTIPFNPDKAPVGLPFIKLDAFLQASGEARYIHDLPLPPRGVNGAFVLSSRALARFVFRIPDAPLTPVDPPTLTAWLRGRFPVLVALLTAQDVPAGQNNRTGVLAGQIGGTDPLLAQDQVEWYGQPMALVLAEDETDAIDIAHYVRRSCILYDDATSDPNVRPPILTIQDAKDQNSLLVDTTHPPYNHILYVMRPNSQLGWVGQTGAVTLDGSACLIVNGTQTVGSQAHFYMETQSALVVPGERGQLTVNPSSQSPDSVQSTIAGVLGLAISGVALAIKRIGGGYGGKTTRSPFVAAPAAVAAAKLKRPVRIAMRREEDMEMIGRRHPYEGGYSLAVATGEGTAPRGRILGLFLDLYSNGGATYDCSFTVMDCVQMRIDSAYMVPNWKTQGHVARTNLASNTAFRSMGLIQGILILEDAIARAAHELGMRAEAVREVNLYQPGQQSVVGTVLTGCYIAQVWQYLKQRADFDRRAAAVEDFNQQNRWRKRGIAMMPVQYGAGYNAAFLEQAGALIDVADQDGSVLVHQGGVEIGQGLATKITQVAAEILNLPMAFITMAPTDLQVVPNPVSTGASTGSGFNAEAVRVACLDLRNRLEVYCQELRAKFGDAWCTQQHIDYWNYPDGWQAVIPNAGGRLIWQAIISLAHFDRINLSAQSRVAIPGGDKPAENLYYTPGAPEQGVDQFTGYTYSAACTEVEIDVLTGETTVLRTDLVYDIGDTLNAAIDIGQVEGAFVQGAGYVLTEDIVIQPDGLDVGRLNSNNTWGYKLPAITTIPLQFNVGFYPRTGPIETASRDMVLGSKEVGEPPLVLAASVYLALKNAVLAARRDRGRADWFALAVPATVQRVREACLVDAGDLRI